MPHSKPRREFVECPCHRLQSIRRLRPHIQVFYLTRSKRDGIKTLESLGIAANSNIVASLVKISDDIMTRNRHISINRMLVPNSYFRSTHCNLNCCRSLQRVGFTNKYFALKRCIWQHSRTWMKKVMEKGPVIVGTRAGHCPKDLQIYTQDQRRAHLVKSVIPHRV